MKITLKLYATLGEYLPEQAMANQAEVDMPDGATPEDVIDRFKVPKSMVHLVLLNGVFLDAEARRSAALEPGDALAIWPPVAGG